MGPKINATNALINNLPTHTETESLIHVLNAQPWLVENSTASMLTYNLVLPVTTSPPLEMDGGVTSSVMVEHELHISGPQWPDAINMKTLVSELLACSSNIYVRIKRHTRNVQKFKYFLTEGTSFLLKGVLDVYEELKRNLIKLL